MGKKGKKNSKKLKKLTKKLSKMDRRLYDDNKFVSRAEFLKNKLSDGVKEYYDKLSPEGQESFIKYILDQEDWESNSSYNESKIPKERDTEVRALTSRPAKTIAGLVSDIKKTKKKQKQLNRKPYDSKKAMTTLFNPEAYDETLLSKKSYRKYLRQIAEDSQKNAPIELDCTLNNFREQLLTNKDVNQNVMDAFWNKHGY